MFSDTKEFKKWLRESYNHFKETKEFAKKTRDYYNGEQLDYWIKLVLANRGQPEQHENNIAKHNNYILGFKAERETEIHVLGVQQQDKAIANLHNAILKTIRENADFQEEIDLSDSHLSIEGLSVFEQSVVASGEFDEFGREHKDITFRELDIQDVYLDPFSRATDYNKDARYISEAFWVDKEVLYQFVDRQVVDNLSSYNYINDVKDDDLENIYDRKRVLVIYTWYKKYDEESKKDKTYFCFWSGETILIQEESPYMFDGFPFEVNFLNRDFKGKIKYWGLYKDIMPLQDNINYAKLRLFNMIGTSKTLVQRNALIDDDLDSFKSEYSVDSAIVMVEDLNGIKDVRMQGHIQQLLNVIIDSRNQINEILGVNKEMLGIANNRMSAVGQERRIETGLIGLSKFLKACANRDKKVARKSIKLIEQYYDTQRAISIVDEDFMQEYIIINEAIKNEYGGVSYEVEDDKLVPISKNKIVAGKYDLIYTNKLKSTSINAERLRANVELVKILQSTNPELVKYIVPEILKDSESPSADKIRRIVYQKEQEEIANPNNERVAKEDESKKYLDIAYKNSMINLNNAKAKAMLNKNQIDLQKAYANAVLSKESLINKQQQNMLRAGKGVANGLV